MPPQHAFPILPAMTTFIDSKQIPAAAQSRPETPEQVREAIEHAQARGLRLAVVTTGHGMKPLGSLVDSMVLDMSGFDSIGIDVENRVAKVGAGVRWQQLVEAAAPHGLTAPFGSARSVGVVGYSTGGGIGPLGRALGLGASAIVGADLVTAGGEIVHVDEDSDPELLWALRGGGGGFGVITSIEIQLSEVEKITGGNLVFPFERASEVLEAWAGWLETVPAHLTSSVRLIQPAPGQGIVIVAASSPAPEAEVLKAIQPMLDLGPVANAVKSVDPATFINENTDPDDGPPVHIEHTLIDTLDPAAIDAAIASADPAAQSPLMMSEFRHLGGALGEPGRPGAQSYVDGKFIYFVMGPPETKASLSHAVDQVCDFGHGRAYFNFAVEPQKREAMFQDEAVDRLNRVFDRVDPIRFFHHAHPVEPVREGAV